MQELNEADISVIRKSELRDRLTAMRKAFDKEAKEREQAIQKAVSIILSILERESFHND